MLDTYFQNNVFYIKDVDIYKKGSVVLLVGKCVSINWKFVVYLIPMQYLLQVQNDNILAILCV